VSHYSSDLLQALVHKDDVHVYDTLIIDGKTSIPSQKLALKDVAPVTQIAWLSLANQKGILAVTTQAGFSLWASDLRCIVSFKLESYTGIPPDAVAHHFMRGITAVPALNTVLLGCSNGQVLRVTLAASSETPASSTAAAASSAGTVIADNGKEVVTMLAPLWDHSASIASLAADDRYIISGDDVGIVTQWDSNTGAVLVRHNDNSGRAESGLRIPPGAAVTCLAMQDDVAVAGYADGLIRVFRLGGAASNGKRYCETEVSAHSRPITALSMQPSKPTFATVGLDSLVCVWTLPHMRKESTPASAAAAASPSRPSSRANSTDSKHSTAADGDVGASLVSGTGAPAILLDFSHSLADCLCTGVQWIGTSAKTGTLHVAVASYDNHVIRVFLGL
jgi:WD40 repeat protein